MNPYSIPSLISFIFTFCIASFILYQGYRNIANKAFALAVWCVSIMEFGNFMTMNSLDTIKSLFWIRISLAGCCFIPANWSLFSMVFARSQYERISKKFKLILICMYILSMFFLIFVSSDLFINLPDPEFIGQGIIFLGPLGLFFSIFILLAIVFIMINLETVYRNTEGAKKWQIKYSIIGMFAGFTFYIYVVSKVILFRFVELKYIPIGSIVILICSMFLAFSFIRHRLMNVDVFVSRQVFYGSFTIIAISVYLIIVGLVGELVKFFHIDFNMMFYPVFALLSLLALSIFLLSAKTRKKVTRFIDRHFYKNRYDYRFEWIELTNRISSAQNINDLLRKFMELVAETMCVNEVSIWLYNDEDKQFYLSGLRGISEQRDGIKVIIGQNSPLIKYLSNDAGPFSLDSIRHNNEKVEFKNIEGAFLNRNSVSVICPLIAKGELAGFITLGKEITGAVYNYEDYDMLKTMCHQAANAIMNIRLSERLVLAKEMDLMNKISSFVLHDLKNFISMLSLIVQNASSNMDNPEFQKDILETISKTIENMRGLMARVSTLPKDVVLNKARINITELIKDTVKKTGLGNDGIELYENYAALPEVSLDPEKIQSVISNLIINAQESLKDKGKVSISTSMDNNELVIEIRDNGPGMTDDFMKNMLFKPFQSTKKKGLGIGLYQCKTIIAAHGGRIEVESEYGKGVSFKIYLPVG